MKPFREFVAAVLCVTFPVSIGWSQDSAVATLRPSAPPIIRSYVGVEVPPVRLANSPRLAELVRAGTLYLTVQDAVALALENNIDIEVARYNPLISDWSVTRAEAGGLLPGVPSNASQAGSVAAGQGVAGSEQSAGVQILGTRSGRTQSTNATISQIGPVTQTLDPIIQEASTFSHTTTIEPTTVLSSSILIGTSRVHSASYQQGLLTGGSVTLTYSDHYLKENAASDVLNPSSVPSISLSVQHNLLQGRGIAVNSRTITVAKLNRDSSPLSFQLQVINIVAQVLNAYYSLEATDQDLKAKKNAAQTAAAFLKNVQAQVRLGSLAPSETISAETQALTNSQAAVDAETSRNQQEIQLKNLLSRSGTADPVMASAHIVPVDPIQIPESDNLPSFEDLVKQAVANRADLAVTRQNQKATEISDLGTRNGVLPNLLVFGSASQVGLAGTGHTVTLGGFTESADPYFVGGLGTALGQMFRRDFPSESIGGAYFASVRNRTAQADYAIDQLQFRQSQLSARKDLSQVEVDLQNSLIGLRQARARYDAAVQNRKLQEQLYASEEKRFKLGASIPYNVIQTQRDLMNAQSSETAALVAYSTAQIALERTTGSILQANQITLAEAMAGKVVRQSKVPESTVRQP